MMSVRKATVKDFGNIPYLDAYQRAEKFHRFSNFMAYHVNRNLVSESGCLPEMYFKTPYHNEPKKCICFVTDDYLNFSRHPEVTKAATQNTKGSRHELESCIAAFYRRTSDESAVFVSEHDASNFALSSLLKKDDVAIVEMGVNTGKYKGLKHTYSKVFTQSNLTELDRILHAAKDNYLTKLVIVEGVHPQDGSVAPLMDIYKLAKQYGAYLMVNDAHGIGVLGRTGRGTLEEAGLLDKVDIISGTFGRALGHTGGFIIADSKIIKFIKYQSYQQAQFSDGSRTVKGIIKAINLIDEEPHWRNKLWWNINYLKMGLRDLGMDVGTTNSAIIPVKIGRPHTAVEVARVLLKRGILTNPILSPLVPKHDARIRMSIMATHTKAHLDAALNAFEHANKRFKIDGKKAHRRGGYKDGDSHIEK